MRAGKAKICWNDTPYDSRRFLVLLRAFVKAIENYLRRQAKSRYGLARLAGSPEVNAEDYGFDRVLRQEPKADAKAKMGSTVVITINTEDEY